MIPLLDLNLQYQTLKEEIDHAVHAVLRSGRFILGPQVEAFEQAIAEFLDLPHAIGCASGTDALMLALRALNIGPGDEVITSCFSFIATAEAICYCGAKPVFVDIEQDSMNLDLSQVEAAINPATRAILPVHLFGRPVDMSRLTALAEQHHLPLVEDCAQSFGATVGGRQSGGLGTLGCFSFFPSKNLGAYGDGGLVCCHDDALAAQLRSLRNHGSSDRYHHQRIGYNSRLDELQAAVLLQKLPHIERYNQARRQLARHYQQALQGLPLRLPAITEGHVFNQYTILSPQRQKLIAALKKADIGHAIYYPTPLHKQPVFAQKHGPKSLPVSERISQQCLSLPIFPELQPNQQQQVIDVLRRAS